MNRFWRILRLAIVCAMLLVTGMFSEGARAEEDYRITNEIVLTDVRISPAKTGDQAQITFLLENRSTERISFGGIMVADARRSRIVASLGNGTTTVLNTIPVAPGEALSADGEALWIEVDGVPRNLPPGGEIKATLSFGTAVIPISLTVDPASSPSN